MPLAEPRDPHTVLASIEGKWGRIFGYEAADEKDPWEFFDITVPAWANDLAVLQPGRACWILVNEDVDVEISNQGPPPEVSFEVPADLAVITDPTEVTGTVAGQQLEGWTLAYREAGQGEWTEVAAGSAPVASGKLGDFDPTLLRNGLYELRLQATGGGQEVEEVRAVAVEGQMKIGHFTLSFLDLAVPLSGLDIEVIRTYDSRDVRLGDFGHGWALDIGPGDLSVSPGTDVRIRQLRQPDSPGRSVGSCHHLDLRHQRQSAHRDHHPHSLRRHVRRPRDVVYLR
jgi:hypothetical protein